MKKLALVATLPFLAASALAQQENARVISATPVLQQVTVPKQVCTTETVAAPDQKTGAGAIMGAIAGGAVGNAVGGGNGKAATTVLGVLGGAILGDRIENGTPQARTVQRCSVQNTVETRITSYNVVYEFGGKQYSVQMPNDPGPTIRLQLTPLGAAGGSSDSVAAAPAPAQVVTTYPVAAAPVYYPYYDGLYVVPSIALGFGLGWGWHGGGWHGGGHGHWR